MLMNHVVGGTFLHSYASMAKVVERKRPHRCVMTDPSMCFGMHIIRQRLQISSLQRSWLMETRALPFQSISVSFTTITPSHIYDPVPVVRCMR